VKCNYVATLAESGAWCYTEPHRPKHLRSRFRSQDYIDLLGIEIALVILGLWCWLAETIKSYQFDFTRRV
jgi:hypothetical protein